MFSRIDRSLLHQASASYAGVLDGIARINHNSHVPRTVICKSNLLLPTHSTEYLNLPLRRLSNSNRIRWGFRFCRMSEISHILIARCSANVLPKTRLSGHLRTNDKSRWGRIQARRPAPPVPLAGSVPFARTPRTFPCCPCRHSSIHVSPQPDIHTKADGRKAGDERRAAGADKRQGDPCYRE